MYSIYVAESISQRNGKDENHYKDINLRIHRQENLINTDINIQNSNFFKSKGKSEYYAFIINDPKLIYLGHSDNFDIPMIPLEEYIRNNNDKNNKNPIISQLLGSIGYLFRKLSETNKNDPNTFGEIIDKFKEVNDNMPDHIFEYKNDFHIRIK